MYKVLVVDDEPIAVESIAFMIKKNFEEIDRIDTSRSGKDAIEKAYQLHPDIIIMDINMPGINGIDAMKQIRAANPTVSFIVISAFDYFDYAVESVALGVEEYLLKPVKENKFVETLRKVLSQIEQNNSLRKKSLEQQERLEMILPILETGFMHSLCMYGEDTQELENYCELFGYHNNGGYVLAIEFGQKKRKHIENKIGAGIQGEKMYEEYKNIIKASFNCIVSPIMLNRIIVYVFDKNVEGSYEQKSESVRAAQKIIERATRIYPDIFIGIGRYYSNIQEAKKSYQEALHALRILATLEEGEETLHSHILHEDDITPKIESVESDYEQLIEDEIYARVVEQDDASVQMAFEQIYNRMCSDPDMNFDAIKKRMIGMVVGFGKRWENVLDRDYYGVLSEIISANDQDKLFAIGKSYINETIHQIASSRQSKANSIIEKANQYIQVHFMDDISLEDVAKEVNLSSYYFSRFYKDVSGIGFSDKLVNVRIEKAKELLKKEELSIKDVSYMIGYTEPNYFSKIFKKATGLTASEYKKMFGL
jgi:two-component system response regulator YesN